MAIRLGVLLSGGGTTLQNFLDEIEAGNLDARVAVVISSRPGVKGLDRAAAAGIPAHVVSRREFSSLAEFSDRITGRLDEHSVELVTMAGFLSLWKIPAQYKDRVINIHPALIPSFCGKGFYGMHVHRAVVESGVKVTGCTIHFADNVYDHGPIVLQRTVPVRFEDTPRDVQARVFKEECVAYPEAVRLFAAGRLLISDGRVSIRETR
jgi:phosphoribosylglycinamide formyltransferase 1